MYHWFLLKKLELKKYLTWDLKDSFGYKTITVEGTEYVNLVGCKVCAAHRNKNIKPHKVTGAKETCSENFINVMKRVNKHIVSSFCLILLLFRG